MSYKITVKKKIKCQSCKGLGYKAFDPEYTSSISVECYCSKCNGEGVVWKSVDIPLSSLKSLLK